MCVTAQVSCTLYSSALIKRQQFVNAPPWTKRAAMQTTDRMVYYILCSMAYEALIRRQPTVQFDSRQHAGRHFLRIPRLLLSVAKHRHLAKNVVCARICACVSAHVYVRVSAYVPVSACVCVLAGGSDWGGRWRLPFQYGKALASLQAIARLFDSTDTTHGDPCGGSVWHAKRLLGVNR